MPPLSEPEASSVEGSRASVPLAGALGWDAGPPLVPLASPPRPSFRHAFACLPQARSRRWSGCSPGASGPRAARRFLQRCGSPSTTLDSPNPEAGSGGRSRRACRWTRSLAGRIQPDRPRSGVARRDESFFGLRRGRGHGCGLTTPVPASAAPTRIYPNLISTRAPPVARWYLPLPEVGIGWRPRGASPREALSGRYFGPSRGGPACRLAGPESPESLEGRFPRTPAKASELSRTRGAFHPRDRSPLGSGESPGS
jgi:hypothetical protein